MSEIGEKKSPAKVIGTYLTILVAILTVGASVMGFAKSYYETPLRIGDHEKRIDKLEHQTEAQSVKMQEMRELLIEIRNDVKMVKHTNQH